MWSSGCPRRANNPDPSAVEANHVMEFDLTQRDSTNVDSHTKNEATVHDTLSDTERVRSWPGGRHPHRRRLRLRWHQETPADAGHRDFAFSGKFGQEDRLPPKSHEQSTTTVVRDRACRVPLWISTRQLRALREVFRAWGICGVANTSRIDWDDKVSRGRPQATTSRPERKNTFSAKQAPSTPDGVARSSAPVGRIAERKLGVSSG